MQVTPRPEMSTDKTTAKLTYVIAEGPQIKVDQVVVRGNTYTHTNVIERKADLDKGDPFSYTKILEAQQNLYRLGIFQRVDIQPEQAGTSVADRNVTIQVEEGKDLAVSGSIGVSKQTGLAFSPLGSASIAHRNLFGTGRYLGLEGIISRGQRQEFFLTEREPFRFSSTCSKATRIGRTRTSASAADRSKRRKSRNYKRDGRCATNIASANASRLPATSTISVARRRRR